MPIYEYKCDNGHVFDVIQRMIPGSPHEALLVPVTDLTPLKAGETAEQRDRSRAALLPRRAG